MLVQGRFVLRQDDLDRQNGVAMGARKLNRRQVFKPNVIVIGSASTLTTGSGQRGQIPMQRTSVVSGLRYHTTARP